jgi:hypothetical protein
MGADRSRSNSRIEVHTRSSTLRPRADQDHRRKFDVTQLMLKPLESSVCRDGLSAHQQKQFGREASTLAIATLSMPPERMASAEMAGPPTHREGRHTGFHSHAWTAYLFHGRCIRWETS